MQDLLFWIALDCTGSNDGASECMITSFQFSYSLCCVVFKSTKWVTHYILVKCGSVHDKKVNVKMLATVSCMFNFVIVRK